MALLRLVKTEIVAANTAAVDQLGQLVARVDAAGPGIGMIVDAGLVELRRVDAVELVGDVAELDGVAIPDDGVRGRRGISGEDCAEDGDNQEKTMTHGLFVPVRQMNFVF